MSKIDAHLSFIDIDIDRFGQVRGSRRRSLPVSRGSEPRYCPSSRVLLLLGFMYLSQVRGLDNRVESKTNRGLGD